VKFLVRYGEIGLKSTTVRRRFERTLERRIVECFTDSGIDCVVERERGRLFVHSSDEKKGSECLCRVFGIVSFSPVNETAAVPGDIYSTAVSLCRDRPGGTFAVRARRSGTHAFTSTDIAAGAGAAILEDFRERGVPLSVNLGDPDWEISVEVRQNRAYLFTDIMTGVGGFPLGTQGKAALLVEKGCSPEGIVVAGWLIMKRGCMVFPFIMDEDTCAENESREAGRSDRELMENALEVVGALQNWDPHIRIEEKHSGLPGTSIMKHTDPPGTPIMKHTDPPGTSTMKHTDPPGTPIMKHTDPPGTPIMKHTDPPGTPIMKHTDPPGAPMSMKMNHFHTKKAGHFHARGTGAGYDPESAHQPNRNGQAALHDFLTRNRLMAVVRALRIRDFRAIPSTTGPEEPWNFPELYPIVGLDDDRIMELSNRITGAEHGMGPAGKPAACV